MASLAPARAEVEAGVVAKADQKADAGLNSSLAQCLLNHLQPAGNIANLYTFTL